MPKVFISPHKKIAYFFIIATIALLVFTIFFTNIFNQKLEITLEVVPEDIKTDFLLVVKEEGSNLEGDIEGKIIKISKETILKFNPEASTVLGDYAQGKVFLYNDSSSNQKIIAASRLESPEGLIFRLENAVSIPAKGKIEAKVKADKPGEEYELDPTTFTLPGLKSNPSLFLKIYAKNENTFSRETKIGAIVKEEDLNKAKSQIEKTLTEMANEELKNKLNEEGYKVITQSNILESNCQANVGEEKEEFPCSGKIEFLAVAIKENVLSEYILNELKSSIPLGKKLISSAEPISIKIEDLSDSKKAVLKIEAQGKTLLTEENPSLSKNELIALNPLEIKQYLEKIGGIKTVKFVFKPFFLKKTPSRADHIKITIIQNEK